MRTWRGVLATVLASVGVCLAFGASALELKEGRDYRLINPPLPADKARIEVTEFFWYGCPHCFDFEPIVAPWARKLPADVVFRRAPALFPNNKWAPHARLYYTLEAMDLVDKLHRDVFNAIHLDRQRLDDEKILFEWVAKQGVDVKKFGEAWASAGVRNRVQQARDTTVASRITGVPSMVVQGKYLVLTPGTYEDLLEIIEQLIDRARAEAGKN
ncbi:MAG: thiol:disulfide interchange protein DsbA/DsbL [Sulfuritalea sp.]|nr:thiol:disulfide interchange protein DsbA/DsbL [Sulfuritalea sp.]